jgi:DNA-directed RNA polymerase subunit omega
MRLEEVTAKALVHTDNDRYVLATVVSRRAEELNNGAEMMIEKKIAKKLKSSDIAIYEVAEGKIDIKAMLEKS